MSQGTGIRHEKTGILAAEAFPPPPLFNTLEPKKHLNRYLKVARAGSGNQRRVGTLFETWATRYNQQMGRWEAGSGAVFDLRSNERRPEGWTSADAAGLAVLPGLVRYDEVSSPNEIQHAFRFTVRATNGHVWPASHTAGNTPGALPMGARLRLKSSVDISGYPSDIQKVFRAMKRYGLIVADNGSDMFISGTMDSRWNNDELNPAFRSLSSYDFEVIGLGWNPPVFKAPVNLRIVR